MDPVSAAASVTALVSFALQSCSFISQFVKAIYDTPNRIKALASRVDQLHQALLQIAGLIKSQHLSEQDENHPQSKKLRLALRACADDLHRFQLKLYTLNGAHDKVLRRAWFTVKSILGYGNTSWGDESSVLLQGPPTADHTPSDRPEHQLPADESVDSQGFSEVMDGGIPHASSIADFSMEEIDARQSLGSRPRNFGVYEDPVLHFNPWG